MLVEACPSPPFDDQSTLVKLSGDILLIQQAREDREAGARLTELHRWAVNLLATQYGIYTTENPSPPEKFRDFRKEMDAERALKGSADYETNLVGNDVDRGFRILAAMGFLGTYFSAAFDAVTAIRGENVQVINPVIEENQLQDGTVMVESMQFTVPSEAASSKLSDAFQLLGKAHKRIYRTRMRVRDGQYIVEVRGLTEDAIRSIGRTVGALVALEDAVEYPDRIVANKGAWKLPNNKARLIHWRLQGHTFHPLFEGRLIEKDKKYQALKPHISATYVVHEALKPFIGKDIVAEKLKPFLDRHLLGTDASATFQGMRAIVNGFIREVFPTGSARNKELAEAEEDRLAADVAELTRDPVDPDEPREGPPVGRTLRQSEKTRRTVRRMIREALEHPGKATIKLGTVALGGVETVVDFGRHTLPYAKSAVQSWASDRKEYNRRKARDVAMGRRIDDALQDALFKHMAAEEKLPALLKMPAKPDVQDEIHQQDAVSPGHTLATLSFSGRGNDPPRRITSKY